VNRQIKKTTNVSASQIIPAVYRVGENTAFSEIMAWRRIPMNRTNIVIIAAAVVALLAIGNAQTQAPKTSGAVGRYQLFSGETSAGGSPNHKAILRIDTETGTVDEWITNVTGDSWYRTGSLPGKK